MEKTEFNIEKKNFLLIQRQVYIIGMNDDGLWDFYEIKLVHVINQWKNKFHNKKDMITHTHIDIYL